MAGGTYLAARLRTWFKAPAGEEDCSLWRIIPSRIFTMSQGFQRSGCDVRELMCIGAKPPFDHPHIFIDMGGDNEAICSYCSTRFVYDDDNSRRVRPARM